MPLTIENRGTRAAVIQLDATQHKRRQTVRVARRNKKTGEKRVISKERVIGEALTILSGEKVSALGNGRPIPDELAKHPSVVSNPALRVSTISDADWTKAHRGQAPKAPEASGSGSDSAPKAPRVPRRTAPSSEKE